MRLIDADALAEETKKKIKANHECRMAVVDEEFIDLINDAPTECEWISVKDRLPEESGEYLTCRCGGKIMSVFNYSAKHKLFNALDALGKITSIKNAVVVDYWMPLPEPPKED